MRTGGIFARCMRGNGYYNAQIPRLPFGLLLAGIFLPGCLDEFASMIISITNLALIAKNNVALPW